MSEEVLEHTISGSVAEIILSRPQQYNSFNSKLRKDLANLIKYFEGLPDLRVVVLRGSGPGFTAGADLKDNFPPPISTHLKDEYKPIFDGIVSSRLLYVAAVHGSAAGIGASLAMVCDILIMGESAKLSMIFTNIGLVPDGGATWLLIHALGYRRALQTVVEGGQISAKKCLEFGLANRVVGDNNLKIESINLLGATCGFPSEPQEDVAQRFSKERFANREERSHVANICFFCGHVPKCV